MIQPWTHPALTIQIICTVYLNLSAAKLLLATLAEDLGPCSMLPCMMQLKTSSYLVLDVLN